MYLFTELTTFDFDLATIHDMPDLIGALSKQLKGIYEAKGKEFHEPYNLNITNSKGRLTPVKNMPEFWSIVREFPTREKVFFSVKPYFNVQASEITAKDRVVESKEVVSELNFRETEEGKFNSESVVLSETNFLDTLDEVTKSRVRFTDFKILAILHFGCPNLFFRSNPSRNLQVDKRFLKYLGDGKSDKEIYNMLNEMDGDVDAVLDAIWG